MAGGKVSPRQKMINMMYLVLTALLALNISKDMLKAFAKVNSSLKSNLSNINEQSEVLYSKFSDAYEYAPLKVGPKFEVADSVKKMADEFRAYVSELNDTLIQITGGYKDDGIELAGADNKSVVSNLMLKKAKKGQEFREKINLYRDYLLGLEIVSQNEELINIINSSFKTDKIEKDGNKVDWEFGTFNNVPLIAVLTFLSQYQVDASSIESKIVENLFASVSADDIKFTTAKAQVISPKNYVMEGDSFRAEISIAAFDSTSQPMIVVTEFFIEDTIPDYSRGDTIPANLITNGKGIYTIPASGIGTQKRATKIVLSTDKGDEYFEKIFDYQVAKPLAVVSPTEMNVFYKGLPNPIAVSVPGFSPEDLEVIGQGVSITKTKPGLYIARVSKKAKKEVKVIVKAKGQRIGEAKIFRTKKVPPPDIIIAMSKGGLITKNNLSSAQGIQAKMNNFAYDLNFRVIQYDVKIKVGEFMKTIPYRNTALFDADLKKKIKKLRKGSDIIFTNIKAKALGDAKDVGVKECSDIVFTIK